MRPLEAKSILTLPVPRLQPAPFTMDPSHSEDSVTPCNAFPICHLDLSLDRECHVTAGSAL